MRTFITPLAATLAVLAWVILGAVYADHAIASPRIAHVSASHCAEDSACWVWSRMGNRKRGVVTVWGTPLVVGPCRFARLFHTGHLRYGITLDGTYYPLLDQMRGDVWARMHGCDAQR